MAMHGFDQEELNAPLAEINTTPLVDVMLVLMVIFLVTAPMISQAIPLELPTENASTVTGKNAITISVDKEGLYYWDKETVSESDLDARLATLGSANPTQAVMLRADGNTTYAKVNHALAAIQRAGLTNLELLTQPE